jgi:hypothetical protein
MCTQGTSFNVLLTTPVIDLLSGASPDNERAMKVLLSLLWIVGVALATFGIMETRPDELPPADIDSQIAEHENWCYSTMGRSDCYATPQSVRPTRLINVDPANRYPLTPRAYREVVAESEATTH